MRNLALVPDALVVGGSAILLFAGRLGWLTRSSRRYLPTIVVALLLLAFAIELWVGSTLASFFGGGLVQDRFSLFTKAAVLLAAAVAIAVVDWTAEDMLSVSLAMPLLATFGVMVAASSGDVVALWAGLELAAAAGVVMVSLRRPDLALRMLVTGAVASTMLLVGLAFLYATVGTADLRSMRGVLLTASPTLALAVPVFLLFAGLALRAALAPFHLAGIPAVLGSSPLAGGLVLGILAMAAATVAIKIAGVLGPTPSLYTPFLEVIAAVAMVGGGAIALASRSPRARMAYLAVGQIGWIAAGLVSHVRAGTAASLFLLGAFAVAAACGPAVMGRAEGGEHSLAGLGAVRPARAAGMALAMLSLAGAPPLAGFFGEFAVAAALAQSAHFGLLVLAVLASVLSMAAVAGTLRLLYLQSPLEESRRGQGAVLPAVTRLSTAGAVVLCVVIAAYGLASNPILGLANQGAEALGLR